MNAAIQSICYKISKHPEVSETSLTRSQLHEVIAAFLGYKSHAAMVLEDKSPQQDYVLSDAEFIILNVAQGRSRAENFGMSETSIDLCIEEMKIGFSVPVFVSVDDFYDDTQVIFLEKIQADIFSSDAIANSNADFDDLPYLDQKITVSGDLWKSTHDWSIEDTGVMEGEYSSEGDRFFNGNRLDVTAKFAFAKAGRAGLVFLSDDSHCNLYDNDDWYDPELFMTTE